MVLTLKEFTADKAAIVFYKEFPKLAPSVCCLLKQVFSKIVVEITELERHSVNVVVVPQALLDDFLSHPKSPLILAGQRVQEIKTPKPLRPDHFEDL